LKLKQIKLLSSFAFKINLRHYSVDQILNPKMPAGVHLRAAPHGMVMPAGLTASQAGA
jgi:hypothetical protein